MINWRRGRQEREERMREVEKKGGTRENEKEVRGMKDYRRERMKKKEN